MKVSPFDVSSQSGYAGYTQAEISDLTAVRDSGDSIVQQAFRDELDINNIIKRYGLTGQLPLGPQAGFYADLAGVFDYDSAVERVSRADEAFMALPPELREKFENSPARLVEYVRSHSEEEFNSFVNPPAAPVEPVKVDNPPAV